MIARNVAARLAAFYDFDGAVLNAVGGVHEQHQDIGFADLASAYEIGDGPELVPAQDGCRAIEVLRLVPQDDYDPTQARICHNAMGCPIDAPTAVQAIHLFAADPGKQLIVAGNPGIPGRGHGRVSLTNARRIAHGNLAPVVDPLLAYLKREGIATIQQLGGSFGAARVNAAGARASEHGIEVTQSVLVEPVDIIARSIYEIGRDFAACEPALAPAIERAESTALSEAHSMVHVGKKRFVLGLLRPTNIAIVSALAMPRFEPRTADALNRQPGARIAAFWGEASEIAPSEEARLAAKSLQKIYGNRFLYRFVRGMKHADPNDINLQTALYLQGLAELNRLGE